MFSGWSFLELCTIDSTSACVLLPSHFAAHIYILAKMPYIWHVSVVLAIAATAATIVSSQQHTPHTLVRRSASSPAWEEGFRTIFALNQKQKALAALWEDLGLYLGDCICEQLRDVRWPHVLTIFASSVAAFPFLCFCPHPPPLP